MAIDSRDKRASAAMVQLYPLVDGSLADQGDRQQMVRVYRGIAAGGAAPFKAVWARFCNSILQTGVGVAR